METVEIPEALIELLRNAKHVAALTGAGISAESGIPTFREAQTGLWSRYNPEELATPEAFSLNPRLVWEWYSWRRELVAKAEPNPGHYALVEMEKRIPIFTLITQNVDGLHRRAGSGARFPILELHGNIQRNKCFTENHPVETWEENGEIPPHCPYCGSLLRPDVIWFGEALPEKSLTSALEAATRCEVFLVIGTSGLVHPAASLPYAAAESGGVIVEINPTVTPVSKLARFTLEGKSGRILPSLVKATWEVEAPK